MCSPPVGLLPSNVLKEICSSSNKSPSASQGQSGIPVWGTHTYAEGDRHKPCLALLVGNSGSELCARNEHKIRQHVLGISVLLVLV